MTYTEMILEDGRKVLASIGKNGRLNFPKDVKAVLLPLLDNPKDINKLFKDSGKTSKDMPIIFYFGNDEETEELIRYFGIQELQTKGHRVQVYPFGKDAENVREKSLTTRYYFQNHWIFDKKGIPCFLKPEELFDSIVVFDSSDYLLLRCLDPFCAIDFLTLKDGTYALQIYLHHQVFSKDVFKVLERMQKKYAFYARGSKVDLDIKSRREVGNVMLMRLGLYRQQCMKRGFLFY